MRAWRGLPGLLLLSCLVRACLKQCSCSLDQRGRRLVACTAGGLRGQVPVGELDHGVQILKISAPTEGANSLTLGPVFQGFQKLEEVHIIRSGLPAIGKHSFWGVPTLMILNLTQNHITQVADNNFRGLVNLLELILDDNRIESMGSGTFQHLLELRVLSLRKNRLKSLASRLFLKLGKLRILDLSYNDLQHLVPDVFKDVQELRTFACRECGLRNMNPHMYSLLSNLATLDLGDNQFKYLDKEEFRDLKKLQALYLDGNHFPVVLEGTFQSQAKLKYLNLGRSHIAKVTNRALENLTSLEELDLSYNKLDRLESASLSPLGHTLRTLLVSGNNIRVEEFTFVLQVTPNLKKLDIAEIDMRGGLPLGLLAPVGGLRHLNLSSNGLIRFPVQLLSPVPGLSFLDISWNRLNYLEERAMSRLVSVETVALTGNPWACDRCHILPMYRQANSTPWLRDVECELPHHLSGRTLVSLASSELSDCGSGLDYKERGFAGLALTHRTSLGLLAGCSAAALLLITMAGVVGSLLYGRRGVNGAKTADDPAPGPSPELERRLSTVATIAEMREVSETASSPSSSPCS